MSGAVFPPCWLFGLRHPSAGAYRLLGGARSWDQRPKMSGWSQSAHRSLLCLPPAFMTPERATAICHLLRDTLRLAGRSGPCSSGVTASAQGSSACKTYVHPPRVKSLFPPVLWSSCNQALLAFKAKCSVDSSSLCWIPRLGQLVWGSELSLLWENFCNIINLQFVGC